MWPRKDLYCKPQTFMNAQFVISGKNNRIKFSIGYTIKNTCPPQKRKVLKVALQIQ